MSAAAETVKQPIRIDIGCGPNKKAGFVGVDTIKFDGVDYVLNAGVEKWPWADGEVDEAHASHFLEHLTNNDGRWERVHFFNELHRVLKKDGRCTLVIPHWASERYYGDPTHKEPFSEMGFYYLDPTWRAANAPHTDAKHNPHGYSCDFACTWGYTTHPSLQVRNAEYQQHALTFWKGAAQDIVATLVKR